MKRSKVHVVTSPEAWEVLASPVRTEIAEAIRLLGPCSISEIAALLDRPADSLYRHIDLLVTAGFVREAGVRKGDRNIERLVDVVADDFHVEFSSSTGAPENRAIVQTANSFLGAMGRAVRDSAAARQLVFTADERNISINYELSWLTPQRFQEVRSLIRRLKQIMDEGKKSREGRLYVSLAMACPVTRKRGAARTSPSDAAAPSARSRPTSLRKKARKSEATQSASRSPRKTASSPPRSRRQPAHHSS